MSQSELFTCIYLLLLFSILVWWGWVEIPYIIRRVRSHRWPTAEATIQKGCFGAISLGRYGSIPVAFMGYAYTIQGVRYAGAFVLYRDLERLRRLSEALAGLVIQIRYDPSDLNTSYLTDTDDSRFEGLHVSQDPQWIEQAPPLDLQEAIRRS